VLSFDGTAWRQYLRGRCVNHVAVAADGSIWASAATAPSVSELRGDGRPGWDATDIHGLYRIVPDAMAAGE
jgi:hypothetical protein